MTGIEKICEKILEDAKDRIDKTITTANKKASEIINSAKEEAEQRKKEILEQAQTEAEALKKRKIAGAQLENRKMWLKVKQDIIEDVLTMAIKKLKEFPNEEYEKILIEMIKSSANTGEEVILISEYDSKRVSEDFVSKINSELKAKGLNGNTSLNISNNIENGGFILKQGDIEINNSFDTILKFKRDELEEEIVKELSL